MSDTDPAVSEALRALYDEVDRRAAGLAREHGERIVCRRGCHDCCVDHLTVFEVEADNIRRHHGELLAEGAPGPEGACAFLEGEGACRIYGQRPYVCRTQGLPLRWIEETADGRRLEMRDICPLNDEVGPAVETLSADACWGIGPYEGRLAELQRGHGGTLRRVALRDLFGGD